MPDDLQKLKPWIFLGGFLIFLFLVADLIPGLSYAPLARETVQAIIYLSPLWLPVFLAFLFWIAWERYIVSLFLFKQTYTLLEIKLPQDVERTAAAAELMMVGLNITSGETTWVSTRINGSRRPTFSLELVSLGGAVHFYIWTRAFYRSTVEYAVYSQYPDVEISEVDDYALKLDFDPTKMTVWGCEFDLNDKADAYPIKTYVDYELDKSIIKEEHKVDPLSLFLDFLGHCNSGGQLWFQIILQGVKGSDTKRKKGTWFQWTNWKKEAEEEINRLLKRDPETKSSRQLSPTGFPILPSFTDKEKKVVEALERSITKSAFHAGVRGIYISTKETFNPIHIIGLLGCFKQFSSPDLNGFNPTRWHATFDYPWQDYNFIRQNRVARKIIELYKRRAYFHPPYSQKTSILTVEEVATLFHFPGSVAGTPTLDRTASKKAQPPVNLPV